MFQKEHVALFDAIPETCDILAAPLAVGSLTTGLTINRKIIRKGLKNI
jgi:hypothetical protein